MNEIVGIADHQVRQSARLLLPLREGSPAHNRELHATSRHVNRLARLRDMVQNLVEMGSEIGRGTLHP